jgi:heme O synthase-like polyprenyltransferase
MLTAPRTLIALGAVTAAGAVASVFWWRDRNQDLERCEAEAARCVNQSQIEGQERSALGISAALGAVSVGLLAAGATWLAKEKHKQGSLELSLSPRAFRLRFAF